MEYIKDTLKGATALSIISALALLAFALIVIIGFSAVVIFAVAFPVLLLVKPVIRRVVRWLDVKATNKLIELSKRRSGSE